MRDFSIYSDHDAECVPSSGKVFRISFDHTTMKFRVFCSSNVLASLRDAFSDSNPASFFVNQYGYNVDSRISPINQFGFFP